MVALPRTWFLCFLLGSIIGIIGIFLVFDVLLAELPRAPQGARERSPIAKRFW